MNEFEIIRRYFSRGAGGPGEGAGADADAGADAEAEAEARAEARADAGADAGVEIGIGDDAAVLAPRGRIVVTVDTLVPDVHFPADAPARAIGHRALAVSLSDVAAMGARPRWCTLALTLPRTEHDWLDAFASGFFELAARFGVTLVGGNLTRGPLSITVDAIGSLADEEAPLTRAGGRPGDDVYVTGTLGDAAGGLACYRESASLVRSLVSRYLMPMPRVEAGRALLGLASAAIDVSDGLSADLGHICEASGCGAEVDVDALPCSEALRSVFSPDEAARLALSGGDDYELCFTARPDAGERILAALGPTGTPFRRIGRLTDAGQIVFRRRGERVEPRASGYLHFE